jgi:hypothetical protein
MAFCMSLWMASTVRLVDERTPPEWASTIQAALNAGAGGLAPLAASLLGGAIYRCAGAGVRGRAGDRDAINNE